MPIRLKSIDSSLRLVKLLSLIPKAGRAIGTKALREKLAEARFDVDLRTVQRDLNRLADSFPLFCEDRRPEPVWSWVKNAAEFSAPGLDASSALAYRIVEQHLSGFFSAGSFAGATTAIRGGAGGFGVELAFESEAF